MTVDYLRQKVQGNPLVYTDSVSLVNKIHMLS